MYKFSSFDSRASEISVLQVRFATPLGVGTKYNFEIWTCKTNREFFD